MATPISVYLALAVVASGGVALADPIFSASVASGPSNSGPSAVSSTFTNTVIISNGGIAGTLTGNEFAVAGPGGVGASSSMALSQPGVPGLNGGTGAFAQSSASAAFSDFIIMGPEGATTVFGSLDLALSGSFETSTMIFDGAENVALQAFSQIDLGVSGSVAGVSFSGAFTQLSGANGQGPTGLDSSGTGVFSGDSAPTGFTLAAMSLPVGTPFPVSLQLAVDAGAGYSASATVGGPDGNVLTDVELMALNDFSGTFSFPTSGPVFNLPDGYTIDSVSADIVNNRYLGGEAPSSPEPGTFILLGLGLLLTGLRSSGLLLADSRETPGIYRRRL